MERENRTEDVEKAGSSHGETESLSEEHRQYLLQRHGTVELDPMPSMDDADPYNWPKRKKEINLALIAFHAMMATFTAAAIQSAFVPIALDLHVSVQRATYLTRARHRHPRRRPALLAPSCEPLRPATDLPRFPPLQPRRQYRLPAAAIGTAVVSEMFFKRERATYMGIWTIMVTCGVPIAPFIFGFVAERVSYRWIYWVLAMINGVQFILYFLFGPETLCVRDADGAPKPTHSVTKSLYFSFHRIDPRPLTIGDFIHPLSYVIKPRVWVPAMSYAMVFLWAGIMPTILMPQIFPEKFGFNTQQVGLQFLSVILGSVIGEQMGGRTSDWWMWRRRRALGKAPPPEYRLWLSYSGFVLSIIGTVVFLVQVGNAGTKWNITPLVGVTIASVGNQLITTVLITYAVDCYRPDAAAVGVFIVFVRQVWGFIGPFWLPNLIAATSFNTTAGIAAAFIIVFSIIPIALLQAVA
ncbi:Major facilitator superfamily domain-containing protein [Mycena venus]|uniref:Major facilitator superfamily domain-containing protein n=1 Tax=Mycena venus TaxID=2733690 RepID=A0A8H6XM61_9AGAR|nr:Major facilitator superfamily domain-containing protein [Mycena venus]